MKTAIDYVTQEVDYPRPYFIFPDLDSPEGNPMEYFKLAKTCLFKSGFRLEAKELEALRFQPYEQHFDIISKFLNFQSTKVTTEDEEYIYIKIKKSDKETTQNPLFNINSPKEIKDLIDSGHDFTITNCYGRNHLYYINDPKSLDLILESNKTHHWFEVFDLDNFNSTLLHNRDIHSFAVVLKHMFEESPKMTKTFLYGTNTFGNNAFGYFLKECDSIFTNLHNIPPQNVIDSFSSVIHVLNNIDPSKSNELMNVFDLLEAKNPKIASLNLKTVIFKSVLESDLKTNDVKPKASKMKI